MERVSGYATRLIAPDSLTSVIRPYSLVISFREKGIEYVRDVLTALCLTEKFENDETSGRILPASMYIFEVQ